ncbi:L-lactate permease [Pseudoponticoccus marisrubri]|uniref:L-lactate permease n=1 Tax=Pseudoponticoccus marisrubri TaxID=1685382 RepID=A0A0W7WI84_9RHOB|nr:L-lactate permease [Pseudoponticoccus marisrubri]KUF10336.1 lactate permease [Pseudoponticoccus marisrubri]
MQALLAATPLAVILVAMGLMRRSAVVAGLAGLVLALVLALTAFAGAGITAPALLGGVAAEAGHSTLTILWIILPALAIYEFQKRAGAIARIKDTLASLTDDRRLQAILIAWFFGLFMEGAAGFGTPVALAAPLLVGLGYAPLRAIVLALLGHAAGVSFGAVGTPALAQLEVSGLDPRGLALATAALHALCGPLLLTIMVRLAASGPLSLRDIGWTALAAACFALPSVALAALIGPELPTLAGALIGAAVFVALLPRQRGGQLDAGALLRDLAPYMVILALVLLTRLVGPLQALLSGLSLDWQLAGRFSGAVQPLYHPGTMLALGLCLGALATGRAGLLGASLRAALARLVPVALALLVMLALSRLMVHAGMIATLANAAAGIGAAWPLVAPFVGVLGTFITGSATASNILFTELQLDTAARLGHPAAPLVAAQGFGAAIGNIIAPHNIIAGSATVGLTGREGEVLTRTVLPCLLYGLLGGAAILATLPLL